MKEQLGITQQERPGHKRNSEPKDTPGHLAQMLAEVGSWDKKSKV